MPELPRHRLRMISKLAEGAFGTVSTSYIVIVHCSTIEFTLPLRPSVRVAREVTECNALRVQVYVAEADGVPEYEGGVSADKRLVAVKFLSHEATRDER